MLLYIKNISSFNCNQSVVACWEVWGIQNCTLWDQNIDQHFNAVSIESHQNKTANATDPCIFSEDKRAIGQVATRSVSTVQSPLSAGNMVRSSRKVHYCETIPLLSRKLPRMVKRLIPHLKALLC